MNSLIDIDQFSVEHNSAHILNDVSITVEPGEMIWLIGPNGAGKTTLLRSMLGIMPGTSGSIQLNGSNLQNISRREIARKISYVPQTTGGTIPFTCFQFVLMARYPRFPLFSGATRTDELAARRALEETAMLEFSDRRLDTLSGGERQRIFIAAALAQETEILLLDEPTACLDPRHHVEVLSFLAKLNHTHHRTIICATHDLNSPAFFGGRVVALDRGKIIFDGSAKTALSPEILRRIYGLSFQMADWPGRPDSQIAVPEIAI